VLEVRPRVQRASPPSESLRALHSTRGGQGDPHASVFFAFRDGPMPGAPPISERADWYCERVSGHTWDTETPVQRYSTSCEFGLPFFAKPLRLRCLLAGPANRQ
jgi:hypothetical protein